MKRFKTPHVVILASLGLLLLPGCGTEPPMSDGDIPLDLITYRIKDYGETFTARNPCGGTTLIVKPGQFVLWQNHTEKDQKIEFDKDDKLIFGVESLSIEKGGYKLLQVDKDLEGSRTHMYRFSIGEQPVSDYQEIHGIEEVKLEAIPEATATVIPDGPPGIIVCPPGETCG